MRVRLLASCLVLGLVAACSQPETRLDPELSERAADLAHRFVTLLTERRYPEAYSMTDRPYQAGTSVHALQSAFENIVPADWGPIRGVEISGFTLTEWPSKRPGDLVWYYVAIVGDDEHEGVTVIVSTTDDGQLAVRPDEFGRP